MKPLLSIGLSQRRFRLLRLVLLSLLLQLGIVEMSGRPPNLSGRSTGVFLPTENVDVSVINFSVPLTITGITKSDFIQGFQGDFIFDSRVIGFQNPTVSNAELTEGNWAVFGTVLAGPGPMRIFRVNGFTSDGISRLPGSGVLLNLRMIRLTNVPGASTALTWRTPPDNFFFIDTDLNTRTPDQAPSGLITIQQTISIYGTTSYCSNPDPNPVSNVRFTLSGDGSDSLLSDGLGHYQFSSLDNGGNYVVTPTKSALPPGTLGINLIDFLAIKKHLQGVSSLAGCNLVAADVNGDNVVDTLDAAAVLQFYMGSSDEIGRAGQYQFSPASRTYSNIIEPQPAQNYDALVFGDVTPLFAEPSTFDPNADGPIYAIAIQPDGKILIGGDFGTLAPNGGQTISRTNLARLNQNGTVDLDFRADTSDNGTVFTIAVQADGQILVGGQFNTIHGQTRRGLARLDRTSGVPDSFDPGSGTINAIVIQPDNRILVGGQFATMGGQARRNIARLDPITGLADSFDPNSGAVATLALQSDGKVLIGGSFTNVGGIQRNRIARLDAVTGAPDSFNPNANAEVFSIALQSDGKILAGGRFTAIGGQVRNCIARLDSTTGVADSFDPSPNSPAHYVYSVATQTDGKILVGGIFSAIGGQPRNNIARIDPITGLADSFDPKPNWEIRAITVQEDNKILVGGFFTTMGNEIRRYISRIDPSTGLASGNEAETTIANSNTLALPRLSANPKHGGLNAPVATSPITENQHLVAFQGDLTFDERVITLASEPIQKSDLTNDNWIVTGKVLSGSGPVKTLRIAGYSNNLRPLSGQGALFELRIAKLKSGGTPQLKWAETPNHFFFIDSDLKTHVPTYTTSATGTSR